MYSNLLLHVRPCASLLQDKRELTQREKEKLLQSVKYLQQQVRELEHNQDSLQNHGLLKVKILVKNFVRQWFYRKYSMNVENQVFLTFILES